MVVKNYPKISFVFQLIFSVVISSVASADISYFENNTPFGVDGSSREATFVVANQPNSIADLDIIVSFEKIGGLTSSDESNNCSAVGGAGHLTGNTANNAQFAFRLIGPDGTSVTLVPANYFTSTAYAGPISIRFDDSAAAKPAIATLTSGAFRPSNSLAAFLGKTGSGLNGTWKLVAQDSLVGDATCFLSAQLVINNGISPATSDLSISDASITEGDSGNSNLNFQVTRTNGFGDAYATYTITDSSASRGSDFIGLVGPHSFFFPNGVTTKTVQLPIVGENLVEANEALSIKFLATSSNLIIKDGLAQGTILDNDVAVISVQNSSAQEGNYIPFTISINNPVDRSYNFSFESVNSTATAVDLDYEAVAKTLVSIPANFTGNISTGISSRSDNKVELDEIVNLKLSTISAVSRNIRFSNSLATLEAAGTILNNDQAKLSISNPSVNEGGELHFLVTTDRPIDRDISFFAESVDQTASARDYTRVPAASNFGLIGTANTALIPVKTILDSDVEGDETLGIIVSNINSFGRDVIFTGSTSSITGQGTILESTQATVSAYGVAVQEGQPLNFRLGLSSAVSAPVVVNYSITNGSATIADSDYSSAATGQVTFAPYTTEVYVSVQSTEDNRVETDENLSLTLTGLNAAGRNVVLSSSNTLATGIITNNDEAIVTLTTTDANEGSNLGVTVSLSKPVDRSISVNYATSNGLALSASDYSAASATLTFAAGETSKSFNIATTTDSITERNESVNVTLSTLAHNNRNVRFSNSLATLADTATILNDDASEVRITNSTVAEGQALSFTISLTNPVDADVVFSRTTTANTATSADLDYTALAAANLTFTAGNTTAKTISINTGNDTKVELNEAFNLALSNLNSSGRGVTFAGGQATLNGVGTIENNDSAIIDILPDSAAEGTSLGFVLSLSNPVDVQVALTANSTDGTARAADGDFAAVTNRPVTFAETVRSATLSLLATDDTVVEATESFGVTFGSLSAGGRAVTFRNNVQSLVAAGTITDNDVSTISIADSNGEEGSQIGVVVSLSKSVAVPVDLTYSTANGSALTSDNDYTGASNQTIRIPANSNSFVIPVATTEDNLVESNEAFTLTLASVSASGYSVALATDKTATATINNDDNATISVTNSSVTEGGNLSFSISLSNPVDVDISFARATADQTALAASDYSAVASSRLTFAARSTTAFVSTVSTDSDTLTEADEILKLTLSSLTNGGRSVTFAGGAASVSGTGTITNDDISVLSLTGGTAVEGGSITFTVTASNPIDSAISFTAATAALTAGTDDYTATTVTKSIAADLDSPRSVTITVPTKLDTIVEGEETFTLNLSALNTGGRGVRFSNSANILTTTSTITDDDSAVLSISNSTAVEGSDLLFNLALSKAVSAPVTVNFSSANGTAQLSDNDYLAASNVTVTFPANETQAVVALRTVQDNRVEGPETVTVSLSGLNAAGKAVSLSEITGAVGTITDNDATVISIGAVSVTEGGTLAFPISLSAATDRPITVTYNTSNDTATIADLDYTQVNNSSVTIPANSTSAVANVTTTADDKTEANEKLTVTLTNIQVDGRPVSFGGTATSVSASGTINNDDLSTISISNATAIEGSALSFTISLSNPVDTAISFKRASANGTATTADPDYTASALTTVTFDAGSTTAKTVTVNTNNDDTTEANESFSLVLSNLVAAGRGVQFTGGAASINGTGTITDNDESVITVGNATVVEGGNLSFPISINNPVDLAITLTRATNDGTALASNDYTALAAGTVTFPANSEANQAVSVVTTADSRVESASEQLSLVLSNLSTSGRNVKFLNNAATLTATGSITDNDSAAISIAAANANEGSALGFNVSLSNPVDQAVTVQFRTTDDAATAGSDYTAANLVTLTIPAESNSATASIATASDDTVEANENLTVTLSNPVSAGRNVTLGSAKTATGTIVNDDISVVSITDVTAAEGSALTFTVSISKPVDRSFTFTRATANGTATVADDDYTNLPVSTITIPLGSTTAQSFSVVTTQDNRAEGNETLKLNLASISAGGRSVQFTNAAASIFGTGTITDGSAIPTVTLTATPATIAEATAERATLTATLSEVMAAATTLNLGYTGTATRGSDFAGLTTITIPAGSQTTSIFVTATNDSVIENNETVIATILSSTGAALGTSVSASVTINDDEATGDDDQDFVNNLLECVTPGNCADSDGDGILNHLDLDSDNDGISDSLEADIRTANLTVLLDSDNDGKPNMFDLDSDNDGIADNLEAQSSVSYIAPLARDNNSNGIDDAYDSAYGRTLITPMDTNSNGTDDTRSLDSDADGTTDQIEAFDFNYDNVSDFVATGSDVDSDGLDNAFDTYNNTTRNWGLNAKGYRSQLRDSDGDQIPDFRDTDAVNQCTAISVEANRVELRRSAEDLKKGVADSFKHSRNTRSCKAPSTADANKIDTRAQSGYGALIALTNSVLPQNHFVCSVARANCANFDVAGFNSQFNSNAKKVQAAVKSALGTCTTTAVGKRLINKARRDANNAKEELTKLPNPFLSCQ